MNLSRNMLPLMSQNKQLEKNLHGRNRSDQAAAKCFLDATTRAEVVAFQDGTRILKDAINASFRDWVTNMYKTHYVLGTACGPYLSFLR